LSYSGKSAHEKTMGHLKLTECLIID